MGRGLWHHLVRDKCHEGILPTAVSYLLGQRLGLACRRDNQLGTAFSPWNCKVELTLSESGFWESAFFPGTFAVTWALAPGFGANVRASGGSTFVTFDTSAARRYLE